VEIDFIHLWKLRGETDISGHKPMEEDVRGGSPSVGSVMDKPFGTELGVCVGKVLRRSLLSIMMNWQIEKERRRESREGREGLLRGGNRSTIADDKKKEIRWGDGKSSNHAPGVARANNGT